MLATLTLALALHQHASLVLDPAVYVSPSGEYSLSIDPLTRSGYGAAEYELARDGEVIWADQLDFALRDCRVTDSGAAIGFAITARLPEGAGEDFLVIDIDPRGRVVLADRVRHTQSEFSSDCWPRYRGILVDATNDRFVLRIKETSGSRREVWWRYRISSGERLPFLEPRDDQIISIYDETGLSNAVHVRGTPLDLCLWKPSKNIRDIDEQADFITLNTFDGTRVWKLELPTELAEQGPGSGRSLASEGAGRFSVWDKSRRELTRFRVAAAQGPGEVWRVEDLGREPRPWTPSHFNRAEQREAIVLVEVESTQLSGPPADDNLLPNATIFDRLADGGAPPRIPSPDGSLFLAPHDLNPVILETRDGEPLAVLDRHADRSWVRWPAAVGFGADGDLWLLDYIGRHLFDNRSMLTRYDAGGTPLSSLPIEDSLGFDSLLSQAGNLALISPGGSTGTLIDLTTGELTDVRVPPPVGRPITEAEPPFEQWNLTLSKDGTRIRAFAASGLERHLLRLP